VSGPVGTLIGAVDRAAFVTAFGQRLRHSGVPVNLTALTAFSDALAAGHPSRVPQLYWLARVTLVQRQQDLAAFDRVFDAVFAEALLAVDPHARRGGGEPQGADDDAWHSVGGEPAGDVAGGDLPWHTLPRSVAGEEQEGGRVLPELMPSAVTRIADVPLDQLDPDELRLLGRWLEESAYRWPTRRSRRTQVRTSGGPVALRATLAASRRTGWEPMLLQHHHAVRRPVTITLVTDVSQSMQSHSTAYLHLMRVFARTRRAETFAFSTALTRLTPALVHRSAEEAVALAEERVVDRFGGTHLASSLRELLASRHGNTVRGGVLVIASDGWDSDDPADLAAVLARLARRARRVVWLNPRAAAPGFEPRVGSMAAALPYCDAFLPAHTLRALPEVFDAITGVSSRA